MVLVLGIFSDQARALQAIEGLRSARFDTQSLRLIGGPDGIADFTARAGPGANVAAGPADAVVGGLVASDLPEEQLKAIERRVEAGAVVLLADGLEADAAAELAEQLRQHHAEDVINSEP